MLFRQESIICGLQILFFELGFPKDRRETSMGILKIGASVAFKRCHTIDVEVVIVDALSNVSDMKNGKHRAGAYRLPVISWTMTDEIPRISAVFSGSSTC